MKTRYKNKRDQYKAERDEFEKEVIKLKKLQFEQKKEKNEYLNCTVYCENCQIVGLVDIPRGNTIKESGCAWCGVTDVGHLVTKVNT